MATLYILGNGFDLAHGLPTSYECFRCYLRRRKKDTILPSHDNTLGTFGEVLEDLEKYYPDIIRGLGNAEWNNFEEALATPNPQFVKLMNGFEFAKFFKERLALAFAAWASDIEPNDSSNRLRIDPEARFLNFNYTMTLEKAYAVPDKHVLHIHGSAEMYQVAQLFRGIRWSSSEIIFGHGQNGILDNPLVSHFYKNTKKIFEEKQDGIVALLRGYGDITEIKCFGHSFGAVDDYYFAKLASLCPKAKWFLGYQPTDKTQKSLNGFVKRTGIKSYELMLNSQIITEE